MATLTAIEIPLVVIAIASAIVLLIGAGKVDRWLNQHTWFMPVVAVVLMLGIFSEVIALVSDEHDNQVASCERANQSRPQEIENLEADVTIIKELAPPSVPRAEYILKKETLINAKISSQTKYAKYPHSTVRARLAIVDCQKAYGGH
jgi:hypothetical protein